MHLQVEKGRDLVTCIKRSLEQAVQERCNCPFSSTAIHSNHFHCQTIDNVLSTHLTYRAILNGTSDLLPASTAMEHIQDWVDAEGTIDYYFFVLNVMSTRQCTLRVKSLKEKQC